MNQEFDPSSLLFEDVFELQWQMYSSERLVLLSLLRNLKPKLAIEIGTYKGGSLQAIAKYSSQVISVDANPLLKEELGNRFSNVEFVAGYSQQVLPGIVDRLNDDGLSPEFVLIDGDHSTEGVRSDVNLILKIKPQSRMIILMHDGFNPECRQGMLTADWSLNPHVQHVDVDFVPGLFSPAAHDTAEAGSMWSGLGFAVLTPYPRTHDLVIQQRMQQVVDAVVPISCHRRIAPEIIRQTTMTRLRRRLASTLRRRSGN